MQTDAQKRAQKKADAKSIQYAVKYRLNDIEEGNRLKTYLEDNNISANSYLKRLIKEDLDNKGYKI